MPTYRSINVALHSQFDIEMLPEYMPLPQEQANISKSAPSFVDDETSTCSVYIPVLPGSTFWISYSICPPIPAEHYFLFKLYINGVHIVTSSTGASDGWRGKIMFGLYERSRNECGKRSVEKRMLCFTPPDGSDGQWKDVLDPHDEKSCLEIKVHRAHSRRRVGRELREYKETLYAKNVKGIDLISAGLTNAEHPKRFYKFALTDPIDQPFATFKYFYRTWEQLLDLDLLDQVQGMAEEDNLPIIEPDQGSVHNGSTSRDSGGVVHSKDAGEDSPFRRSPTVKEKQGNLGDQGHDAVKCSSPPLAGPVGTEASHGSISTIGRVLAYVPRGTPHIKKRKSRRLLAEQTCINQGSDSLSAASIQPHSQDPAALPRPWSAEPHKNGLSSCTAYRPHPVNPQEETTIQHQIVPPTDQEHMAAPAMEKRKAQRSMSLNLMNVLSSSWRRRGSTNSEM